MSKRTDVHRPSAFNHDDYEFIGCGSYQIGDCALAQICINEANKKIADYQDRTGAKFSTHSHGGNCHVCGATFLDFAVFLHRPSGDLIRVGVDCAEKIADGHALAQFSIYRDKAAAARRRARGIKIGRERLEERCPAAAAILDARDEYIASTPCDPETGAPLDGSRWVCETYEQETIADIVGRLYHKGSLSEAQWNFLDALCERQADHDRRAAERAAERESRPEIPSDVLDGRVELEGEVVALKAVESVYGLQTKVLVKSDAGWVVWGTLPSALVEAKHGDRVRFVCRVTAGDERGFGFFSRPSKPAFVSLVN
jgi:hypothetical protein